MCVMRHRNAHLLNFEEATSTETECQPMSNSFTLRGPFL